MIECYRVYVFMSFPVQDHVDLFAVPSWLSINSISLIPTTNAIVRNHHMHHLLISLLLTSTTFAIGFWTHSSYNIPQNSSSNRRTRAQLNCTTWPSSAGSGCLYVTSIRQKSSGIKAWICWYRSTTKPRVGNWQLPRLCVNLPDYSNPVERSLSLLCHNKRDYSTAGTLMF